jgi:hypothetical protein
MHANPHNRRFERLVGVSLALLVTMLLGVLLHAGMNLQVVA